MDHPAGTANLFGYAAGDGMRYLSHRERLMAGNCGAADYAEAAPGVGAGMSVKIMNSALKTRNLCIKNEEFSIRNDGFRSRPLRRWVYPTVSCGGKWNDYRGPAQRCFWCVVMYNMMILR